MIIEEEVLESSAAKSAASHRPNRRRALVIGAATLAVAGATVFAVVIGSNASDSRDAPRTTINPTAQDAANDEAIAEPNQVQGGSRSRDDVVRDLVERGLVPAATLDDGTQITRAGLRPTRTRDEVIRDLVERGLVPAASLDDGTQITATMNRWSRPASSVESRLLASDSKLLTPDSAEPGGRFGRRAVRGGWVEYRVLGNFEVVRDGRPVDLGAFRQRALLALLLTEPNSVFSTDRILDELWGAEGGVDKQNALWVYVSGLRKALEPERAKRTEGTILLTRPPGYLIEVQPDEVDALRFEQMVFEGRALAGVDPAAASLVLGEALGLWRGRAFEDFTYEAFAHAEISRLEELRLEAVELRVDADLERGLARELISELESLVRQHPLNERLSGKLMLALYRSSQAEALRAYRLLKSRLGEELGIEPSSWIRQLESKIVTGDESLEIPARLSVEGLAAGPGPAVRGYELREHLGGDDGGTVFRAYQAAVGREVAIKVIRADLANDPGFIRRFQTEAQVVATLEHPHIVPLYDFWREPDAAYLVTRLMRESLTTVLERGPLTVTQTITMLDQLGDALQTAHRSGIVHGDIKADNVLLDSDGNAYLSDFGIAVGDAEVAPSSDVYGLGVIIAEALTGTTDELDEIRRSLPDQVARVIDRATGVDATARYGNVHKLVTDLREALTGDTPRSPAISRDEAAVGNPYKGLRAFDAVDAVDFFGRERLVERLIARLGVNGTRGRFIAVVGPSGSGKSSAVRGGLLPAVRRGALPLSGSWFTIEMTPAPHPFDQLEEALLGVALDSPPSLLDLLAGDRGIERVLDEILPNDGSQVLLLIDQFEELFTQVGSATANRFIANIVSAVNDAPVASASSPRFEPTSTTGRCSIAVSVNCSERGPRSSRR